MIKYFHFSPTRLINSIKRYHSCKILYTYLKLNNVLTQAKFAASVTHSLNKQHISTRRKCHNPDHRPTQYQKAGTLEQSKDTHTHKRGITKSLCMFFFAQKVWICSKAFTFVGGALFVVVPIMCGGFVIDPAVV